MKNPIEAKNLHNFILMMVYNHNKVYIKKLCIYSILNSETFPILIFRLIFFFKLEGKKMIQ